MRVPVLHDDELPIILNNPSFRDYGYKFNPEMAAFGSRPFLVACVEGHMRKLIRKLPSRWQIGLYCVNQSGWERSYRNQDPEANKDVTDARVMELVSETQIDLGLALLPFDEIDSRFDEHYRQEFAYRQERTFARQEARDAFYGRGYDIRYEQGVAVIVGPTGSIQAIHQQGKWRWI